jgi:hypothetical protein
MNKYTKAIKASASVIHPRLLKQALDGILDAALRAYKAKEIDVLGYSAVCEEYAHTLVYTNAVIYM